MANDTTTEETKGKKKDKGEKKDKVPKVKPDPYIINSEDEKDIALLEIKDLGAKLEKDYELEEWENELKDLNEKAVSLKSKINDHKKTASSERKSIEEKLALIKDGIGNYEVNKALGKTA
ncbi:hypothetical protein LEP1GSC034_1034 [Leptospira interrogans str. 2003000735]|uniref:Uncharacterized protein n=2 Tax=Leptospira interrogans TaxID=173 RepID=A0A829DBQ8_LEPIR|nr:hypothetical protein [Leptospira interrogans]EMY06269.1 hypothetical protein LEP1GSC029_3171 [Leptospira interrogans str. 2002000626]EMY25594.1 hypothetical protein LEP1GSC115_1461 [Leptospira interrogans serovar Australis str. 200703203]EKN89917.1 hypothetical protein LEP1GSC027_3985 [Leptospira interrogans str. 2002000624]EKQ40380.1 hypothetical protein LEP1GSC025_2180 [Leptospira interrogans str. 2002000621]EKQ46016.1 hypothetical protein LEP1GSC026_3178 [Leptospira interrogans str. 2002